MEIGKVLADVRLPNGFLRAAAEGRKQLSGFTNREESMRIAEVVEALRGALEL